MYIESMWYGIYISYAILTVTLRMSGIVPAISVTATVKPQLSELELFEHLDYLNTLPQSLHKYIH